MSERTGAPRRVLLAMGSNLGARADHLRAAVAALGEELRATSAVYETDPVGGPEQGPYLNLVVAIETDLSAQALLARGQAQEAAAERVREVRWGPRTLDVDIVWIDGETVDDVDLQVPHPRMFERAFVMVPVADVAPDVAAGWTGDTAGVRRVGALEELGEGRAADEGTSREQ